MSNSLSQAYPRVLLSADQIRKRVQEMARQISNDFRGRTLYMVAVLENSFLFMADLVREMDIPVVCQFVQGEFTQGDGPITEIFYSPEVDVKGQDVLLVEALIQSGITSDFLIRNLMARGARSVKLAVLLDKQTSRRMSLQPDYFGFLMNDNFVVGYGLGDPHIGRNLPYIAAKP
ncbi:MAG TPA: phosphoribosyltransferase family protein [Candidatus Limnocylindrales bacterium]|nr:phosphoribosyltransferase family protein [Candidatus Limnocylindrales bacterium]